MSNIGPMEIGLIVLVILLFFGATRLPKLGKSMGESIRGFKQGLNDDSDDEIVDVKKDATAESTDETKAS